MSFGYDQSMPRRLGVDVKKCEHLGVFIDTIARNFSSDDFAKNTIHASLVYLNLMIYRVREVFHPELLTDLLRARGLITEETQTRFLEPDFTRDSHDPFLLPDMEKAVERIKHALVRGEKIAVWSDYDCDGIPGGVMLVEFLRSIGLEVRHYIPHRHAEGYGLNENGLAQLAREGISLVITVDLGISDVEPVLFAKEKNIEIIITDHHLVSGSLPEAYAIINPKRPDSTYPFDSLCGAGVAWKLVQGMLRGERFGIAEGQEKWLLDLVGLATLSDMVPLVGENRMLAHYGLLVMKRGRRPGIAALMSLLRIRASTLTEDDIGFMIAPRINAASRMDAPETAAHLLATKDAEEARELAQTLQRLNDKRKGAVATTVKEVNKRLLSGAIESPIIIMGNPRWRPGVLGLVANSLVAVHRKPVFLWGREGGTMVRGSCRSDGSLNVVALMSAARDVFDDFGGHYASGGFSVSQERVHELSGRLQSAYEEMRTSPTPLPDTIVERELPLHEITHAHRIVKQLAPFGQGNPKPLFLFPRVSIAGARTFGKAKDHLALTLSADTDQVSGIAFFSTPNSFTKPARVGERFDVVGHIETDWRGGVRVRVVDLL